MFKAIFKKADLCGCGVMAYMWRSEDSLQEAVLSLYIYLLSHLPAQE